MMVLNIYLSFICIQNYFLKFLSYPQNITNQ